MESKTDVKIFSVQPQWLFLGEVKERSATKVKLGRCVFLRQCSKQSVMELAVASPLAAKQIYSLVHSCDGLEINPEAIAWELPAREDALVALHEQSAIIKQEEMNHEKI